MNNDASSSYELDTQGGLKTPYEKTLEWIEQFRDNPSGIVEPFVGMWKVAFGYYYNDGAMKRIRENHDNCIQAIERAYADRLSNHEYDQLKQR